MDLLSIYTVSFFGHRRIERFEPVELALTVLTEELVREKEYVSFLVGQEGDFDQLASWAIRRARRNWGDANSEHICVLPYERAAYRRDQAAFERYYSRVEICEASAAVHPKRAVTVRNRAMVDRSDLCVFYAPQRAGGAFQALRYARRRGRSVYDLAVAAAEKDVSLFAQPD